MTALIVISAVVYVMIGLVLTGFFDIEISIDFIPFITMVLLWPLVLAVGVLTVMCMAPIRLGKKLSTKYFVFVEDFFDKLFNN